MEPVPLGLRVRLQQPADAELLQTESGLAERNSRQEGSCLQAGIGALGEGAAPQKKLGNLVELAVGEGEGRPDL
ncbi:hypothetical protein [Streptomyces sp. NPDC017524]|uniref:hypothetical protein n=1 Tax=Streptomyces sp. NPDC017524 TaxID=3364999 RepID=UPI003795F37E